MILDITRPLAPGMAGYPGDPEVEFDVVLSVGCGDAVNLKRYSFGSHAGTHADAPYHLLPDGKRADELPVDAFIGSARVFEFRHDIGAAHLSGLGIRPGEIVLFKTECANPVGVLPGAAQLLAGCGVRAVGIDRLSIETDEALPVHRILLGAGIPIIEGLELSHAEPGVYRMTAMLMRIADSDGAPLRAMLEK